MISLAVAGRGFLPKFCGGKVRAVRVGRSPSGSFDFAQDDGLRARGTAGWVGLSVTRYWWLWMHVRRSARRWRIGGNRFGQSAEFAIVSAEPRSYWKWPKVI